MENKYFDLAIRLVLYCTLIALAYLAFRTDANVISDVYGYKFTEDSYTELYQEFLLLISGIAFFIVAVYFKETRPTAILLGGFLMVAFCRELDFLTDSINTSFWGVTSGIVITIVGYFSLKSRKNLSMSFQDLSDSKAAAYILAGVLVTFMFSRLFGKGDLWKEILEGSYDRSAKNAAEECVEVMGDILIFIGSVEYLIHKFIQKHQRRALIPG